MTSYLGRYGPRLLEQGYAIVPIKAGTKFPKGLSRWQNLRATPTDIDNWLANGFAKGGVGVLTRHTPAVDIDIRDSDIVKKLIDWCQTHIGSTAQRVGQSPKTLLVYRAKTPFKKASSKTYVDAFGIQHRIELLGDGQQFVAYAVHPHTKQPYAWGEQPLADIPHGDLPSISLANIKALFEYFDAIVPEDWEVVSPASTTDTHDPAQSLIHAKPPVQKTPVEIQRILLKIDPEKCDYDRWVTVGMALYHQFDGAALGYQIWDNWCRSCSKYVEQTGRQKWASFKADLHTTNPVTFATIIKWTTQDVQTTLDSPFPLIHARDLLKKLGPIDWLVKNFIEANTTGILFGDPASYKSFIAMDIALHIATRQPWHGRATHSGPVIYIAGEGHGGLARRVAAWQTKHGDIDHAPIYFSERAAQIYDKASAQSVTTAIDTLVPITGIPRLIVVDTLARNFGAGDENSTADMGLFIDHVNQYLRAPYGCTVLIVHHTGHHNKDRARGAMALKAGVDFEYRVEKPQPMLAKLSCTKMKDAEQPEDLWLEAEAVILNIDDEEGEVSSLVFQSTDTRVDDVPLKGKQLHVYQILKTLINENGGAGVPRDVLRTAVIDAGVSENATQFRKHLEVLRKKNFVYENDGIISTDEYG